jgi:hypothetical protein
MTRDQVSQIIAILSQERDEITMSLGKRARKQAGIKADIPGALDTANERLDRLLQYQDTSAERTKIIDQASDFETPSMGVNQWASPLEQAQQLKRQQRQMRRMHEEHLARTGRGKKVISIDLKGNKVYQQEQTAVDLDSSDEGLNDEEADPENRGSDKKPLRYWNPESYGKNFIKPVYVSTGPDKNALPASSANDSQPSRVVEDADEEARLLEM